MPRNGSGTMSVTNSFSSGTTISSSEMNANFTDFASEVTNSLPRDGQAAMTGQMKITAGTAAAPGLIFSTDTNTGVYRFAADSIGFATGGAARVVIDGDGVKTAAGEQYDAFPAGTEMLFYQATAPAGWTSGGANDVAVRVVNQASGVGGSTGGSTVFSSVFDARTITQANLPNVNLTAASNGAHQHYVAANTSGNGTLTSANYVIKDGNLASTDNYDLQGSGVGATIGLTSSNGAHTHTVPLGGSGTAMDFDVQYMNWITAIKD
jgi:hypothetical protein